MSNISFNSRTDKLKIKGIQSEGYGVIPKSIMLDINLSYREKAFWGYLASYTGGGCSAFPSINRIKEDLSIGKNSCHQHINSLVQCGYIEVEKEKAENSLHYHNVYILNGSPDNTPEEASYTAYEGERYERCFTTETAGYGLIPKAIMNSAVSIGAKAVYCLLASFAGGGNVCFPSKDVVCHFLQIGMNTHTGFMHELVAENFVVATTYRKEGRKGIAGVSYELVRCPDKANAVIEHNPSVAAKLKGNKGHKNKDTKKREKKTDSQNIEFSCDISDFGDYSKENDSPENKDVYFKDTKKRYTNNNRLNKYASPFTVSDYELLELDGQLGSDAVYHCYIENRAKYMDLLKRQVYSAGQVDDSYILPENKSKLVGLTIALTSNIATDFLVKEYEGAETALNIFRHCLIELLSSTETHYLKRTTSNASILGCLNYSLFFDNENPSIAGLAQYIIPSFLGKMKNKAIRHKINYIRVCIIMAFEHYGQWFLDGVETLKEIDPAHDEHFVDGGFLNKDILDIAYTPKLTQRELEVVWSPVPTVGATV